MDAERVNGKRERKMTKNTAENQGNTPKPLVKAGKMAKPGKTARAAGMGAVLFGAVLAQSAQADTALIRIEAKRNEPAARAAAEQWARTLGGQDGADVVIIPLPGGWSGVAIGPMDEDEAKARLAALKSAKRVPADAFVTTKNVDRVQKLDQSPTTAEAAPTADTNSETAPQTTGTVAAPDPAPVPDTAPRYIRVEAKRDLAGGQAALTEWRKVSPDASLWRLSSGWYAIALGPFDTGAEDALAQLKSARKVPKDAFLTDPDALGQAVTAEPPQPAAAPADAVDNQASVPAHPAPEPAPQPQPEPEPEPVTMPPIAEVQAALRWAGHYSGAIDGKPGKGTQAAIDAEIKAQGADDAATAMDRLVKRYADWRRNTGLSTVEDQASGLSIAMPVEMVAFERREGPLVIYAPKPGKKAAVILLSREGQSSDLADLAGLVTALGWVPTPKRDVTRDQFTLSGQNDSIAGLAKATLRDGMIQGFVLIWPAADAENGRKLANEMDNSLRRLAPPQPGAMPATVPAPEAGNEEQNSDGIIKSGQNG